MGINEWIYYEKLENPLAIHAGGWYRRHFFQAMKCVLVEREPTSWGSPMVIELRTPEMMVEMYLQI